MVGFSRRLGRPSDEADAEDQYAEGQHCRTSIGEIDEPARSFGIRRQHGEEKRRRNQDRCDRDRAPHKPLHGVGEVGLVHVAEGHKCQDEPDACMRMPGAPQILAQRILHVRWIADQKRKYAHSTKHYGRQDDQKDASQTARFVGHDFLHSGRTRTAIVRPFSQSLTLWWRPTATAPRGGGTISGARKKRNRVRRWSVPRKKRSSGFSPSSSSSQRCCSGAAGTFDYCQAWVFLAVYLARHSRSRRLRDDTNAARRRRWPAMPLPPKAASLV